MTRGSLLVTKPVMIPLPQRLRRWADAVGAAPSAYGLPSEYIARSFASNFVDESSCPFQYQPDVYGLAGHLFETAQLQRVYDVGCGAVCALRSIVPPDAIVGIDIGQNLATARRELPAASFLEHNLNEHELELSSKDLAAGVVVCADVVEQLSKPRFLLNSLRRAADSAPFMLISTPDRTRCRGIGNLGPPGNPAHIREWNADEFYQLLMRSGLHPQLFGHTVNSSAHLWKSTLLSIHGKHARYTPTRNRSSLAIISTFNDIDFLPSLVKHLLDQGVCMYFVDNWSTDGTFEWLARAKQEHSERIVDVERFPAQGATETYQWEPILDRKADIAAVSGFDWVMHYDSDELRESPWSNVSLADAISFVDECGYNCIDHAVIEFRPTTDGFAAADSADQFFRFCEFGRRSGHFVQVKCWKNTGKKVDLSNSGGHFARFDGQKPFPLKFLLKHYPLRSLEQTKRKVFAERAGRRDAAEKAKGWHAQYDNYISNEHQVNLWKTSDLIAYNPKQFLHEYIVERLSSIGLGR